MQDVCVRNVGAGTVWFQGIGSRAIVAGTIQIQQTIRYISHGKIHEINRGGVTLERSVAKFYI